MDQKLEYFINENSAQAKEIRELKNKISDLEFYNAELIAQNNEFSDVRSGMTDLINEKYNEVKHQSFTLSMSIFTDKIPDLIKSVRGVGGRAGKKYNEYEPIILRVINKYENTRRGDRFTQGCAITEIERAIHAKNKNEVGSISPSTFKTWLTYFKATKGASIYKD